MSTAVNQKSLNLAWGVHRSPVDAPRKLVIACLRNEGREVATALAVAMQARKLKLAYVAACIAKHESYVCLLRKGKRTVTEDLVGPLCAATGTNLVRQVWDTLASMADDDDRREVERMAAMLRAAA